MRGFPDDPVGFKQRKREGMGGTPEMRSPLLPFPKSLLKS